SSLSRVELPARFISSAASSISGVPSRFCLIWAISLDDMLGASPFICLPPGSWTLIHPSNSPPQRHAEGGKSLPLCNYVSSVPLSGTRGAPGVTQKSSHRRPATHLH